jgi:hypothetical protein
MIRFILIISAILLLQSCMRPVEKEVTETTDTLRYDLLADPSNTLKLRDTKFTGTISSQSVSLEINFQNDREDLIYIYPAQTTIAGKEGNRCTPFDPPQDTIVVASGSSSVVRLNFIPVNSRFLFQHTNLRGDLDDEYSITLFATTAGGQDFEEKISARAAAFSYHAALNRFSAQKEIVPFRISGMQKQTTHEYFKNATFTRAVEAETKITDNEILKAGFWVKLMSYHRHDTLHCRMRFVNQSGGSVEVLARDFILSAASSEVLPVVRSNDALVLQKGDRGEIDVKYPIKLTGEYLLNLHGVRATNGQESYFTELFSLERLQLPE